MPPTDLDRTELENLYYDEVAAFLDEHVFHADHEGTDEERHDAHVELTGLLVAAHLVGREHPELARLQASAYERGAAESHGFITVVAEPGSVGHALAEQMMRPGPVEVLREGDEPRTATIGKPKVYALPVDNTIARQLAANPQLREDLKRCMQAHERYPATLVPDPAGRVLEHGGSIRTLSVFGAAQENNAVRLLPQPFTLDEMAKAAEKVGESFLDHVLAEETRAMTTTAERYAYERRFEASWPAEPNDCDGEE